MNKSSLSPFIYAPIGTPNPEVHSRIGNTNAKVNNKKELFDFTPIFNLFNSNKENNKIKGTGYFLKKEIKKQKP